jgi:hypothetical protein
MTDRRIDAFFYGLFMDVGTLVPALCYNLREAPAAHERNPDYATWLQGVLSKLNFPPEYIAAVS